MEDAVREDIDILIAKAAPLLEEEGESGYPDYGAYVTFEDGIPIIHHSSHWKAKSGK